METSDPRALEREDTETYRHQGFDIGGHAGGGDNVGGCLNLSFLGTRYPEMLSG